MTDTYWVVRLEAFSFETKEEADAFRDKMEDAVTDAVTAMPEAADVTFASALLERECDECGAASSRPINDVHPQRRDE